LTNYTWHQQGDYQRFRIKETRYGLFVSVLEDGTELITALTYDICLRMTPFYQETKAPDYDGRYNLSTFDGRVGGKL